MYCNSLKLNVCSGRATHWTTNSLTYQLTKYYHHRTPSRVNFPGRVKSGSMFLRISSLNCGTCIGIPSKLKTVLLVDRDASRSFPLHLFYKVIKYITTECIKTYTLSSELAPTYSTDSCHSFEIMIIKLVQWFCWNLTMKTGIKYFRNNCCEFPGINAPSSHFWSMHSFEITIHFLA